MSSWAERETDVPIVDDLVAILGDMTADWDDVVDTIGAETLLIGDLAMESIDVVMLIVAIEERYQRKDFAFEELLMVDGRYVEDLTVRQLADFLAARLQTT